MLPQLFERVDEVGQLEKSEPPKEESAPAPKKPKSKRNHIKKAPSFNRRNVYKSMIRAVIAHIRNHSSSLNETLSAKGFPKEEVERVFADAVVYKEIEMKGKDKRRFQAQIEAIVKERSASTQVLIEAFKETLENYKKGVTNKVAAHNLTGYMELYEEYLGMAEKSLMERIL
jgi:hypothetical protein